MPQYTKKLMKRLVQIWNKASPFNNCNHFNVYWTIFVSEPMIKCLSGTCVCSYLVNMNMLLLSTTSLSFEACCISYELLTLKTTDSALFFQEGKCLLAKPQTYLLVSALYGHVSNFSFILIILGPDKGFIPYWK